MLPAKLGAKDEEGGTPALLVAAGKIKSKMPPKLGAEPGYEDEDESEESLDPKQAMLDATAEIVACLGGSKSAAKRLNAALEAHHRACDALIDAEEGESD